jgi:signal transduction histidine kinase
VDGALAVFVDASGTVDGIRQLAAGSCAVTLSALLAIFLLMMIFSRVASRPAAESLKKQRQFITDASHELKTPLTIISANAEILSMNFGENEWSRSIEKQTERMAKLIQSLIGLTRVDEGAKKLASARFNLSDAVYDTAMTFATPAARRELTVSADVPPDICVQGDEASARQLVSILMDNAVKYADDQGKIAVRLALAGKYAHLTVSNPYKCGTALRTDRVFDRFYRASEARTGDGSYGLGLSIAKSIVDAMKGKISAAYENGVFTIAVRIRAKM